MTNKLKKLIKLTALFLLFYLATLIVFLLLGGGQILLPLFIALVNVFALVTAKLVFDRISRFRPNRDLSHEILPEINKTNESKTFLVTGANRGIGLALVKALKKAGHKVIATARPEADLEALAGVTEFIEELDLSDNTSIFRLADKLRNFPLDGVINNGVMAPDGSGLENIDLDKLTEAFKVNVVGPLGLVKMLLPNLLAGKERKIINITSDLASFARPNPCRLYAYQSSKVALNMLNLVLSKELQDKGFCCLLVHPGPVKTRLNQGGTISAELSASSIVTLLDEVSVEQNGKWLDFKGETVPW